MNLLNLIFIVLVNSLNGLPQRSSPSNFSKLVQKFNFHKIYLGSIPRNFKIFIFNPKLSFLGEITTLIARVNSGFLLIHPLYDFCNFPKMDSKKSKNLKIFPSDEFCDFDSKRPSRLENEILRIQPNQTVFSKNWNSFRECFQLHFSYLFQ